MAVVQSFLGGYQPICNDCGIALCWEISPLEYEDYRAFWDAWRCKECDPDAEGSRKRWQAMREEVERKEAGMKKQNGQGMVEYSLLIVLVAVVLIVVLSLLGTRISTIFSQIVSGLGGVAPIIHFEH